MRKIFYFIIAFLFFAECNNDNQENEYNDGKFTISDKGEMTLTLCINSKSEEFKLGNVSYLLRHLYNNGHIIFQGENVQCIEDMKNIVTNRYRKIGRTDKLGKVLDRNIVTYVKINDAYIVHFYHSNIDTILNRMFGNKIRTCNIKLEDDEKTRIKISLLSNQDWYQVSTEEKGVCKCIKPKIQIIILKKEEVWYIATAFATI